MVKSFNHINVLQPCLYTCPQKTSAYVPPSTLMHSIVLLIHQKREGLGGKKSIQICISRAEDTSQQSFLSIYISLLTLKLKGTTCVPLSYCQKQKRKRLGVVKYFIQSWREILCFTARQCVTKDYMAVYIYIYKCTVSLVLKHIKKGRIMGQFIVQQFTERLNPTTKLLTVVPIYMSLPTSAHKGLHVYLHVHPHVLTTSTLHQPLLV